MKPLRLDEQTYHVVVRASTGEEFNAIGRRFEGDLWEIHADTAELPLALKASLKSAGFDEWGAVQFLVPNADIVASKPQGFTLHALEPLPVNSLEAENAALREQVATLTAAVREVFIVEYRGNAWDEDNYKLIGVCSSYDRAVAFASEYLGLTFAFQSVPMSLVYPPERGVWVAMEVDITSFSARITQVTLTH